MFVASSGRLPFGCLITVLRILQHHIFPLFIDQHRPTATMSSMDVDRDPSPTPNMDLDSDMQSVSSYEEDDGLALPSKVHDLAVSTVTALQTLVKQFPSIPEAQRKAWNKAASRALKSTGPPLFKFALIGKTGMIPIALLTFCYPSYSVRGAGKSTLINNLVGDSILPSSASVRTTIALRGTAVGHLLYLSKG